MARKNPYMPKSAANDAPAEVPEQGAHKRTYTNVLADTPIDMRPLSLRAAESYPVEDKRYSTRERRAAGYALDFNGTATNALSFLQNTGFPGFPTLSLLGQLAEYRTMHETLADECIRCWGEVVSSGDAENAQLEEIEAELDRIDLRAVVRQAVVDDQRFGRSHVFFKLRGDETIRDTPLLLKPYSVRKGSFEGVRNIEAYWVTPNSYNSTDPTRSDFYKPATWWALNAETHATRLQTLVSRPVPDMLKPAYSFAGVSMTQLAMPYVDNWLRTRQSISDTVKQFSVSGVKADLSQMLAPGGSQDLQARAQLLNAYRDNRNIMFLDMAQEEFFQVNTPLSGLDALQAQAQEQMSAVSHIPLVKLLGITPNGLNASSEGEIRVFYDYVAGYQKNVLQPLMRNVLRLIQLSLYGAIDENIDWNWHALMELTELEKADKRNKDAQSDDIYVAMGAVTPDQITEKLQHDPDSGYSGVLAQPETLEEIDDSDINAIAEFIKDNPGGPEPETPTPDPALAVPGSTAQTTDLPGEPQDQMVS